MSAHELALLLAVAGGAAAAALALEPVARALGVPTPLAFLLGGLLLGELWDGSHAAARPEHDRDRRHGRARDRAAAGRVTSAVWPRCASSSRPCSALGIAGTAATFGLVALAAHSLAGLAWTQALLLGAVLSPTDPAAVFAAVSRAGAGGARVVRLLEAEAGFNDPVAIALTRRTRRRRPGSGRHRRVVDRLDDGARGACSASSSD